MAEARSPFVVITPYQLAEPGTEHAHQKATFQWITTVGVKRYPLMIKTHAIPNGAKLMGSGTARGRSEGAKMKAEGVRAGVPDMFVPVPCLMPVAQADVWPSRYHGLWIELKRPGRDREKLGGRSEEQVEWQKGLLEQGYAVATAYGWMDAAHVLDQYFQERLIMPENGDCLMALGSLGPPCY